MAETYEVWYAKPDLTRDTMMGVEWLQKHNPGIVPTDLKSLKRTHVRLTTIKDLAPIERLLHFTRPMNDADKVFSYMQGEMWSPKGEARRLIRSLKLHHTSMSVGDVLVVDGVIFVCDTEGWTKTGTTPFWSLRSQEPTHTQEDIRFAMFGCTNCLWYSNKCQNGSQFAPRRAHGGSKSCQSYVYYD